MMNYYECISQGNKNGILYGLIVKSLSGYYDVVTQEGKITAKPRGLFRKSAQSPIAGDLVKLKNLQNTWVIVEILKRKNQWKRPPLANIDQIFMVVSSQDPRPNLYILDSLLIAAEYQHMHPGIIFTKLDLKPNDALIYLYQNAGYDVFPMEFGKETKGVSALLEKSQLKINALCGNTGVGKSTLLNHMSSRLNLPTRDISKKLGRGRHTTRHVELYPIGNGYFADTPGFSSMQFVQYMTVDPYTLSSYFRDFMPYIKNCTFHNCMHIKEKGCAVREAYHQGKIAQSRYQNYLKMLDELSHSKKYII